jgi:hypothetical protein
MVETYWECRLLTGSPAATRQMNLPAMVTVAKWRARRDSNS